MNAIAKMIWQEAIEEGLKEGMEKGMVEGMEKGKKEAKKEVATTIAKKMLKRGTSAEIVAEDTGLDKSTISKLQKELFATA